MTITVKGDIGGSTRTAAPVQPSLQRRVLQMRGALWARTGADTASPPSHIDVRLCEDSAITPREWVHLVEHVSAGTLLCVEKSATLSIEDFATVLVAADRCGLQMVFSTDGFDLEEAVPVIYGLGVTEVKLRLHGVEEIHNNIVGAPDAFERAARGALSLKGIACGSSHPRLVVHISVNAANHMRLSKATDLALAMGADHVVIEHCRGGDDSGVAVPAVCAETRGVRARWRRETVSFVPELSLEDVTLLYKQGAEILPRKRCFAAWRRVEVRGDGDVRVCGQVVGNLRDGTLAKVWNSPAARARRRALRKGSSRECLECMKRFAERGGQ